MLTLPETNIAAFHVIFEDVLPLTSGCLLFAPEECCLEVSQKREVGRMVAFARNRGFKISVK